MKPMVCIFAHPDDEAFGPGGTIAKLSQTREVYLICATKGEAGAKKGRKGGRNLGAIRAKELLKSAKILGIKKVYFLGFRDGTLSNSLYHQVAARIEKILKRIKPDTILTYEPRGISGHLDHIAISMISSFVFERLPFVKKLMRFCITAARARAVKEYFIYRPPGYKRSEIDLVVDVKNTWGVKLAAMLQHRSQIHDIQRILKVAKRFPKKENFLLRVK